MTSARALLVLVAACATPAPATPRHALAAETAKVGDATLEVPADWWIVKQASDLVTLEDPDRKLRVSLVSSGRPRRSP